MKIGKFAWKEKKSHWNIQYKKEGDGFNFLFHTAQDTNNCKIGSKQKASSGKRKGW